MQGTIYTSGIGNVSGTDCAHVPLWITYMGDRCQWLLWGVVTGFRHRWVLWESWESPVVTRVMTGWPFVSPNKCKCNLLYWQSISDVKYYTQGEERPVGDPLHTHVEMYLGWESHNSHLPPTLAASATPTYPGQLGPISVLNPVHPTQPDVRVKGKGMVKSEKGKQGI